MHPFKYDALGKSKNEENKAKMDKRRLLLNFKRHFSPAETSSSHQVVLGENALKNTRRKKRAQN